MSTELMIETDDSLQLVGGAATHQPRIFDSRHHPVRQDSLALLTRGIKDVDLAAPPVVLPDFYHKRLMEMPSSIAVATRDTIRPVFTSAALN
ncbi:MAG: hypothetical protein WB682_04065, partial [Candidatus Dormiibacterota bacterium]